VGTVVIRRGPDTVAMAVHMRVTIDGAVAARLRPKREDCLTLAAGTYQVQAGLHWSRSHVLTLSVPEEGVVAVEVGAPWRLSLFSSTPGSLDIRTVDGRVSSTGYRRQRPAEPPLVFDPTMHPPSGRSSRQVPALRWLAAFLKRRHPAWGVALLVAALVTISVNSELPLQAGWPGLVEHNLIGAAVPLVLLAGMFVLGEWSARRHAARERHPSSSQGDGTE
jgi:hypothetical protein